MKFFIISLSMTFSLLICSSTFALTITEVGTADKLIHWEHLKNSSDLSELTFFADGIPGVFNVEGHDIIKYNPATYDGNFWIDVEGSTDLWAFNFEERSPAYFLLKTGKIKFDDSSIFEDENYFLYENLESLQYGVVDFSVFGPRMNLGKVSHVSIPAPEPSTFLLLGTGFIGLALVVARRRRD